MNFDTELVKRATDTAGRIAFEEPDVAKTMRDCARALDQVRELIETMPTAIERAKEYATIQGSIATLGAVATLIHNEAVNLAHGNRGIVPSAKFAEAIGQALDVNKAEFEAMLAEMTTRDFGMPGIANDNGGRVQ
jgi:hypothetical protein